MRDFHTIHELVSKWKTLKFSSLERKMVYSNISNTCKLNRISKLCLNQLLIKFSLNQLLIKFVYTISILFTYLYNNINVAYKLCYFYSWSTHIHHMIVNINYFTEIGYFVNFTCIWHIIPCIFYSDIGLILPFGWS